MAFELSKSLFSIGNSSHALLLAAPIAIRIRATQAQNFFLTAYLLLNFFDVRQPLIVAPSMIMLQPI
jgi:hypothetical protein